MARSLGSLPNDSLIEFNTWWDEPVVWRVIGKDLLGMPENSVTLITDGIIALMAYDAAEKSNTSTTRQNNGNNCYFQSNIRQWLNSDADAGQWYTSQHQYDAAPNDKSVLGGGYPSLYSEWEGFLNRASSDEKGLLMETHRKSHVSKWGTDVAEVDDKVFLLTINEVGGVDLPKNGRFIPYFFDNASREAYLTETAYQNYPGKDTYGGPSGTTSSWKWWTAGIGTTGDNTVYVVYPDGSVESSYSSAANASDIGCRPAINLPSRTAVTDSTNGTGHFTILYGTELPETVPLTDIGYVLGITGSDVGWVNPSWGS